MPLLVATYVLQIACAVHALRRGASYPIIMMIIAVPFIGCAIYVAAVVLPDLSNSKAARNAGEAVKDTLAPHRKLKEFSTNLEISDTVENKLNLADELRRKGQAGDAVPLLIACLDGPFADNPDILVRLAGAYFELAAFKDCIGSLEHLIETNPDYQSQEAHLLYARALKGAGLAERASEQYNSLCAYYSGPEAKCRHAELLLSLDRPDEAQALFQEILKGAKHAAPHVRKRHREWIVIAERRLDEKFPR